MIKFILNGYTMDLSGEEVFAVTYEAASEFKFQSHRSAELTVPVTMNNLLAIENNHVIENNSVLPYDFIEASVEVDGIDMKIDYAVLLEVSDVIKFRLYGGNIAAFTGAKEKSIQDLDLSEYDHTRNWAFISANRLNTTGITYPLIDYGTLSTLSEDVPIEDMYPAVFVHTIMEKIADELGYTLAGDVITDADYLKLIIPFCNKIQYVDPAVVATYLFEASLNNTYGLTVGTGVLNVMVLEFLSETSDTANRFDGTYYTVPITGTYKFHVKHRVQVPSVGTQIGLGLKLLAVGGEEATLQVWSETDYTLIGGIVYELDEDATTVNLKLGDRVYVDLAADYTIYSLIETTFSLVEITNTSVGYGEFWQVAPNLPNIKQSDLFKYVLQIMGAISQTNGETITLTRMSKIIDNCYTNYDDWSDKLDRSGFTLTFKQDIAQVNHLTYLEDENIVKPVGTDYDLISGNKSLPAEKDLYKAPFSASEQTSTFPFDETLWRVDINGASNIQPRILVSNQKTTGTVHYTYGGSNQLSTGSNDVPYFISDAEFNLGFGNNLRFGKMKDSVNLLLSPKQLRVKIRLNASDINQLDFSKPVWIDYYKCWFYKAKINQFNFNNNGSTVCDLIKLL